MYTLNIPTRPLLAQRALAGTDDIRFWLNGVIVEAGPRDTVLVATTGSVLGALRVGPAPDGAAFRVRVPHSVLDAMRKAGPTVTLASPDGELWAAIDDLTGNTARWKAEREAFPDWRKLVRGFRPGDAALIDPAITGAFVKVRDALGLKRLPGTKGTSLVEIHHGALPGGTGGLVHIPGADFVGVAMSFRNPEGRRATPGWACSAQPEVDSDLA